MNTYFKVGVGAMLSLCADAYAGKVYRCLDDSGKSIFADYPCAKESVKPMLNTVKVVVKLTQKTLQGRWRITHVAHLAAENAAAEVDDVNESVELKEPHVFEQWNSSDDFWFFSGTKWYLITGDKALKPEQFSLVGNVIDFGHYQMDVIDFQGDTMTVKVKDLIQKLEKI